MSLAFTLLRGALAALPYPFAFRLARLVAVDQPGESDDATMHSHDRARHPVPGVGGPRERPTALRRPPACRCR